MRIHLIALTVGAVLAAGSPRPIAAQQAPAIFRYQADGFWLNLHHFLYVLGRAEAQMPDRQRRAVAGAPADQAAGVATLTERERHAWSEVVTFYSAGLSRKDMVFDRDLVAITTAMQQARDDSVPGAPVEPALAAQLERAAPVYRKAWWAGHQKANRAQAAELQALVARHGASMLTYVTRAYQLPWPAGGYPVNVSAFSNWAGAYSTGDGLLVMSSLDPGTKGVNGLEIVFHEAMHQWDDAVYARLRKAATQTGAPQINDLLTHAMIFYTAGEAARSAVPGHVPYAEANGLWRQKGLGSLKPALDAAWQPFLEGKGTLDAALIALVKAQPAG